MGRLFQRPAPHPLFGLFLSAFPPPSLIGADPRHLYPSSKELLDSSCLLEYEIWSAPGLSGVVVANEGEGGAVKGQVSLLVLVVAGGSGSATLVVRNNPLTIFHDEP